MRPMAHDGGGGGSAAPPLPPHATAPVYGGEATAQTWDVPFAWSEMSPAAAAIFSLSEEIETLRSSLLTAKTTTTKDWVGPYREQFDAKMEALNTLCSDVSGVLVDLSDGLAEAWVAARHWQGKICAARGFQKRESEEGFWGKLEDTWGQESPNEVSAPGKPSSPSYARGGAPGHEDGCAYPAGHGSIDA